MMLFDDVENDDNKSVEHDNDHNGNHKTERVDIDGTRRYY